MLNRFVISIGLLFLCSSFISAQKHDYNWILGGVGSNNSDKTMIQLDFSEEPPKFHYFEGIIPISSYNASYSDECGNFIFYTNGHTIADSTYEIMENGTGLNPGQLADLEMGIGHLGFQEAFGLAAPGQENMHYLIYIGNQLSDSMGVSLFKPHFFYTKVVQNTNGIYEAVEKNIPFTNGFRFESISAVRHGNGRDWWIMAAEFFEGSYSHVLLSPTGFGDEIKQEIGYKGPPGQGNDGGGSNLFSPDGTKYVDYDYLKGLRLFDFDRCTGELSNYQYIPYEQNYGPGSGVAFSPNSRFLYAATARYVMQYDLWEEDLLESRDTVGIYDRFFALETTRFFNMQLGPDGRIYMDKFGATDMLHIINNPNEKGTRCEFINHGVQFDVDNGILPHFPNYRLYDWPDSPCDTLGINGAPDFEEACGN